VYERGISVIASSNLKENDSGDSLFFSHKIENNSTDFINVSISKRKEGKKMNRKTPSKGRSTGTALVEIWKISSEAQILTFINAFGIALVSSVLNLIKLIKKKKEKKERKKKRRKKERKKERNLLITWSNKITIVNEGLYFSMEKGVDYEVKSQSSLLQQIHSPLIP